MKDERIFWYKDYRKPKDFTVWDILVLRLENKFAPYITRLTRYFPLSFLWQTRAFHFKYKEINEVLDRIHDIAGEKGFSFNLFFYDQDDRFLILYGQFDPKKKNVGDIHELFAHFQKCYENENSYITDLNEKRTAKFVFVRKTDE